MADFVTNFDVGGQNVLIRDPYALHKDAADTWFTVAKDGGEFSTVTDAINAARARIAAYGGRVAIHILDTEVYYENITLLQNPGIDLIGHGCTIQNMTAGYPSAALYTTGPGYFENIRFANYAPGTYALHLDDTNAHMPGTTTFVNCEFISGGAPGQGSHAAGVGLGPDCEYIFRQCYFRSTAANGLYFHNAPGDIGNSYQLIRLLNCLFYGYDYAMGVSESNSTIGTSPITVEIDSCSFNPPRADCRINNVAPMTYLHNTNNYTFAVVNVMEPHFNLLYPTPEIIYNTMTTQNAQVAVPLGAGLYPNVRVSGIYAHPPQGPDIDESQMTLIGKYGFMELWQLPTDGTFKYNAVPIVVHYTVSPT